MRLQTEETTEALEVLLERANAEALEKKLTPPDAISPETLAQLQNMPKEALISLIQRVSGAMWGIGLKSKEEREDAMLLKLSILALTSDEAKDVVSTSKEYFDRTRGKPAQSIDLNQKIGIVQIVMEAAKLRNGALPIPNLPLALESPPIEN